MLIRPLSARTAVILAHIAALALLGWAGWSAAQRFVDTAQRPATTPPAGRQDAPRPSALPVSAVVAAHLFGNEPAPDARRELVEAPETRLKLTLTGVFASRRESIAHAIIEVEAQPPKSYGVGDSIEKTDARLHAVEPTRVLLERNGQLEALLMPRNKLENKPLVPVGFSDVQESPAPETSETDQLRDELLRRSLGVQGQSTF